MYLLATPFNFSVGGYTITPPPHIPSTKLLDENFLLHNILTTLLVFSVFLALFFFVWGGIQWAISEGEKQKLQAAQSKVTYAIIGLVVVFFSFAIINLLSYLFGLKTGLLDLNLSAITIMTPTPTP